MKLVFLAFAALLLTSGTINAQRDYFTPEEVEIIRDAQQIDKRVSALTHMIDRRFTELHVNVQAPAFKESADWGSAPGGTRLELLLDIKHILQKAVDDIDNLSERPTSMVMDQEAKKKPKGFADLFPVAVRSLASAAQRYEPALKAELDKTKDPSEEGAIRDSLEQCDEILASVAKLPSTPPATSKKAKS